jgi:hypothetical protein
MTSWWIGLLKRKSRNSIFVQTRPMWGNLLRNPCESEGMFLMFGREGKRLRRRKEIHAIVPAAGLWNGPTPG